MGPHPFYIVDVFAEEKYTGNQLAVVRHASDLSESQMQQIAQEMHFSETTFILSDQEREGGYDVRIFTPAAQVPFAGHPTLGSAFIIREETLREAASPVILNLKVGQIPVTFEGDLLWMKQIAPIFDQKPMPSQVAPALGLQSGDIDERFPIEEVSTGLPFLIVPLKTLNAIQRAHTDHERLDDLLLNLAADGVLIFARETYHPENQLNARVFVPELGVPEDPATGSGNGCLAGYLVKHRYLGDAQIDVRVEQGFEIKRPSLLLLKASERNGTIDVNVGGRVVLVARGELV
jgi:trans-2,3-dihydro-3-hydroxyanthranilate isomerase